MPDGQTIQQIIDRESDKLTRLDPDSLSADARAIVTAISALTGTVAAVALALSRESPNAR